MNNHSEHERVMEVTSYFEPNLTRQGDDTAHPAFTNLFVKTEYIPEHEILVMTRRPRSKDQKQMWMAHTLVVEGDPIGVVQYESDRSKFIGRNRELRIQGHGSDHPLGHRGAVLIPYKPKTAGWHRPRQAAAIHMVLPIQGRGNKSGQEYRSAAVIARALNGLGPIAG